MASAGGIGAAAVGTARNSEGGQPPSAAVTAPFKHPARLAQPPASLSHPGAMLAMAASLIALAALVGWHTSAGLRQVEQMMAERSATLVRVVGTEVRNVARYGAARRQRLDAVLEDLISNADVRGVLLERDDAGVRFQHGAVPPATASARSERVRIEGSTLLVTAPVRIDTLSCHGGGQGAGHAECPAAALGHDLDGNYRVVLALDARPYLLIRRSVFTQGGVGAALIVALALALVLHQRQTRRTSSMREALAVAHERARYLERLGLWAGGLAHQIKNPIGSLRGFAQLIAEKASPGSTEATYADLMVTELDGITRRIDRLRDVTRPSPPELRSARPVEVIHRLKALLEPDLASRHLQLELDLPREPGPEAVLDVERFKDLVVNLLMNAIEASPEGGSVRLRLTADERSETWCLSITDEGPGIPVEAREEVLRPFHSTKPGGLGLGLAVAQQAVEDHAGTLVISAAPGGGALVSATWPARGSCAG